MSIRRAKGEAGLSSSEKSVSSRLDPILYPLLINWVLLLSNSQIRDLYETIVSPTPATSLAYIFFATLIGSVILPVVSIGAYAVWVLTERQVSRWAGGRLLALLLASAAVVAQCEISREWTADSPLGGWWSLTLLVGRLIGPVIELLTLIIMLVIAGQWVFGRGRRSRDRTENALTRS